MKTEKRIERLADSVFEVIKLIDKKVIVADIATDHGYLAEKVCTFESVEKVFATDISEKSLSKLIALKSQKHLDKIEPKIGNGLEAIDFADIAVIAGIGGFEIMKMLNGQNKICAENNNVKCRYFVLQPAQNIVELREFLYKNKYKILDDKIVQDGKQFYPIVCIDTQTKQKTRANVRNLWLGKFVNLSDKDFVSFLLEKQNSLSFIENLSQNRFKNDEILRQKRKLKKIIAKLLKTKNIEN